MNIISCIFALAKNNIAGARLPQLFKCGFFIPTCELYKETPAISERRTYSSSIVFSEWAASLFFMRLHLRLFTIKIHNDGKNDYRNIYKRKHFEGYNFTQKA